MNKKIFYLICGVFVSLSVFAGDIERVSATYEYVSSDNNETPAQIEAKAFERAKQQALEDKFGIDVTSVSNTLQINRSNGESAQTQTNVFSLGGTSIRGEWIETIKEQVLEPATFKDGFWHIKVRVEGRARNHATEKTDIRYTFVRNVQDLESPVTFRDGNDLFMRFSTPVAGSLGVYLVDEEQNAFCLLPYYNNSTGAQAVEANKEYLFFSENQTPNFNGYKVTCERTSEQNALYVIFSPNTFSKANDKTSGNNWRNEPMPRQVSYADFLKWLAANQKKDPSMVVRTEIISIRK